MLRLDNISKTFNPGTVNEKAALTNLSLDLADGDFATIVGSNGAGKSTMFNAIAGTFIVDEGNIYLDDEDITFKKEHVRSRVIGHLFQDRFKSEPVDSMEYFVVLLRYIHQNPVNTY